jgi:hypothetical protein
MPKPLPKFGTYGRLPMTNPPEHDDWEAATWEGTELDHLRTWIRMTMIEKVDWLDRMQQTVTAMHPEGVADPTQ